MEKLMRIIFVSLVVLLLTGLGTGTVWAAWIDPPPDLESWWPGDGNANDIWGSNNGTWVGSPAYTPGPTDKVKQGFKLDGTNDYIDVGNPTSPDLRVGGAHTAIAWVYAHENDEEDIVSKWAQVEDGTHKAEFLLMLKDGKVRGHIGRDEPNDWTAFDGSTTVTTDTWHLVAQVWDGTTATVYLDGVQDGTPVAAPGPTEYSESAFLIGARSDDGSSGNISTTRDINGYVDEVQVFDRALTAQEILAEYNAGSDGKFKFKPGTCVDPFPDLVSWWPGDFDAEDIESSYNGVPKNWATYDAGGMVAQAFKLDGTNDYFYVGSQPDLQVSGAHTAIAWVYAHENDEEDIVSKWASEPGRLREFHFAFHPNIPWL